MSKLANFVWSIADQLRGPFRPNEYGDVILPMTILRRLDCIMAPTRDVAWDIAERDLRDELRDAMIKKQTGLNFWNTSRMTFARLVSDPDGLRSNLVDFISGFSENIDVFER